jgi:hypothetical protein
MELPKWAYAVIGAFVVLSLATAWNYRQVGLSLAQTQDQAKKGADASRRSCVLYPVSRKLYAGAEQYGIITRGDLEIYKRAGAPEHC